MRRFLHAPILLAAVPLLLAPLAAVAQKAASQEAAATAKTGVVKEAEAALAAAAKLPKGPANLRAIGKAAAGNKKRREVEAISTDVTNRLGELARAQENLCKAIQPGAGDAQTEQSRAQILGAMAGRMRELIDGTLAPLWSQLPMKALRAGRMDFGSVHARFEAAVLAQQRAIAACQGKLSGATLPTPEELRKAYDAAFEAGVTHALSQHKRLDRAEQDLDLALSGFTKDRRPAVEARLRAAITAAVKK